MTAVKSVYVRCAMAHWLISLSSIGQWLIVSKRLGTQVIEHEKTTQIQENRCIIIRTDTSETQITNRGRTKETW